MVVQTYAEAPVRSATRLSWAVPLVPAAVSGFCLSALFYYHVQYGGTEVGEGWLQALVVGLYRFLGFVPAVMLALLAFVWSTIWYVSGRIERPGMRALRVLALTVALSILVGLQPGTAGGSSGGGILGGFLALRLESVVGYVAGTLMAALAVVFALLLATDMMFFRHFEAMARAAAASRRRRGEDGVEAEAVQDMKDLRLESGFAASGAAVADDEDESPVDRDFVVQDDPDIPHLVYGGSWRDRITPREHAVAVDGEEVEEEEVEVGSKYEAEYEDEYEDEVEPAVVDELGDDDEEVDDETGYEEASDEEVELAEEDVEEDVEEGVELVEEEYEDEDETDETDEDEELEEPETELEYEDDDELEYETETEDELDTEDDELETEEELEELDAGVDEEVVSELADEADDEEPVVEIPRSEDASRQGSLFGAAVADADLIAEATELVLGEGRASVSFLQRRLRVGYEEAQDLLEALRRGGIIDGEEGEPHGHVRTEAEESV